jgi:SAM-dependent methyltransferase
VKNDLFIAHESIYHFASRYSAGAAVLDAGCGTGYGSAVLARNADSVTGVDIDRLSVRYARLHYASDTVRFEVADLQSLTFQNAFDVVVASNSLEHLVHPEFFLEGVQRALRPAGRLIIAVPPIYNEHDAEQHRDIHYHRANLAIQDWLNLICGYGFRVSTFLHLPKRPEVHPNFSSTTTSTLTASDFEFTPIEPSRITSVASITAIFLAESAPSAV